MVSKSPVKQKAAGCSIVGKKAVSPALPEEENKNLILSKEVKVVQLEPNQKTIYEERVHTKHAIKTVLFAAPLYH